MTVHRFFYLPIWWFLFASAIAFGQSFDPPSVDAYVKAEMQRQHIPGLSLLVAKGGKIVLAEGFGLANVELQVPAKPETIFQSGSVGKQFTATAVMMLVEEGKIGLEDPLSKYFKRTKDLEQRHRTRTAEPHRGLRRLSREIRLSKGLDRRRTREAR